MDQPKHPVKAPSNGPCASSLISSIEINKFPIPPSVNKLHNYSYGRVHKSHEYRKYESDVLMWRCTNTPLVNSLAKFIESVGGRVIHIDMMFYMLRKRILCKDGKPKRNDTSNLIKALHDVLCASIIEIDDSYMWSGSFNKRVVTGEVEYVDMVLSLRSADVAES